MPHQKEANHTINFIKAVMKRLELKLNPEKTKLVSMWDGKEDLISLGCTTEGFLDSRERE